MQETSLAAYESIFGVRESIRRTLYLALSLRPETSEELEQRFGMRHQTVSARLSELAKSGLILDRGWRSVNDSGRKAIIWGITG